MQGAKTIYSYKSIYSIQDLNLVASADRYDKFRQLVSSSCRGAWFLLRQTGLGEKAGMEIGRCFAHAKSYTLLDLSGNNIKDKGCVALAEAVKTNSVLTSLILRSNNIGPIVLRYSFSF